MLSHENISWNTFNMIHIRRVRAQDVSLLLGPLFHAAALNSHFTSAVENREVNAIYVDIYRYTESGDKQLIHTSRYPSDQFEVTLYKIQSLHELNVRAYGFEPMVYQFYPDSEGQSRAFKLEAEEK